MQLFALALATQVRKHRPVNVPVELDVQAVRLETARPIKIGQVELTELLELVRSAGSDDECLTSELRMQAPIDPWFERYEQAGRAALSGVTLAEVVTAEDAVQTPDQ